MIGQKFGRLTVEGPGQAAQKMSCLCECGTRKDIDPRHLRSGGTTSCGCRRREVTLARNRTHGLTGTPLHIVWRGMIQRCTNQKNPNYRYYGGAGVRVCQRWIDSFEAFHHDMGDRPPGMTLDRIDGTKPYEPGNCRWASRAEQAINRGVVTMLTIGGRTQCLAHWLKETGVCRAAFWRRVEAGWPAEDAVSIKGLKSHHYHLREAA